MIVDNNTKITEEIIALYEKFGNQDYIGEPVSQIEHMCQCAQLAEANGADDETILAAFLHDIGHLCEFAFPETTAQHMDSFGVVDHEKLGAAFLRQKGFSDNVAKMVEHHVLAKRYLTYKFPEYYDLLSEASKQTLIHQGGVMTLTEAMAFEQDELASNYVALRRWDEQAKTTNLPLPDLDKYKQMILQHLIEQL
jgi:2-amino-1-hydroxyethylphosphonate dioxygenase (glycine-forming)